MKKNFDFKDLMSFGMFLLALLTFIHLMSQQLVLHKAKPPQNFGEQKGGLCNPYNWSTHLVGRLFLLYI